MFTKVVESVLDAISGRTIVAPQVATQKSRSPVGRTDGLPGVTRNTARNATKTTSPATVPPSYEVFAQ